MNKRKKSYLSINNILPLAILISFASQGQEIRSQLSLDKVTLFLKGAELAGKTSAQLPKGESEIILTQVARGVNPQSINIGLGDKAMILSTTLKNDYITAYPESDQIKTLRDSLLSLESKQRDLQVKLAVNNEEIALLTGNRIDALKKPDSAINEAKSVLNFIKENLSQALSLKNALELELSQLNLDLVKQKQQLDQELGKTASASSIIVIKVFSDNAVTVPIDVSYVTNMAGWFPAYDVRVNDIDSPLHMTYKANIYQNSGLDWQNVNFTLSTANPSEGLAVPVLQPWYVYVNDMTKYASSGAFYAKQSVTADIAELAATASPSSPTTRNRQFTDYVSVNMQGINNQYNIDLPFTIKTNSRDNMLKLKETDIPVNYHYTAIPKQDNHVFLLAQIADWQRLELLPGKSTVFFAGNYIGEGYITTEDVKDTLDISLGRDKGILIQRNQNLNEISKPSFFGNEVSQKFAYTIDVNNTKSLPVEITVYDQLPVIQNKAISLGDMKYSGAEYDKESGLLSWKLTLKPNENKQLPFSFNISYPKDKHSVIVGL